MMGDCRERERNGGDRLLLYLYSGNSYRSDTGAKITTVMVPLLFSGPPGLILDIVSLFFN